MKDFPVPIRMVGPGSHQEAEEARTLEMPRDMRTFEMPSVPEHADTSALAATRELFIRFLALIDGWRQQGGPQPVLNLRGVAPATLKVVDEMLGEGEVAINVQGAPGYRVQESVFTGIWRVVEINERGLLVDDWIECGPLPALVVPAARSAAQPRLPQVEIPPGAMNSPALVHELAAQIAARAPGKPAHVLNLTLFPLSPDDVAVIDRVLPPGPVALLSRGFGNCRIGSTLARDVWRVQYFNSMNTMILNTIEVVEIPEVALAAADDLAETRDRLAEMIEWIGESCAA